MLFVSHPKILHKHCLQFLLGVKMALREAENNAYVKFWGDKQRALWYVRVFSEVVNGIFSFFKHLSELLQRWLNLLNARTNCPRDEFMKNAFRK